jgi:hypothetical protein
LAWVGCLAGALEIETYKALLSEAGFEHVSVEITQRYTAVEAGLAPATLPAGWEAGDRKLASAFVRATKPPSAVPASPHQRGTRRPVPMASSDRGCCDSTCCT